MTARQRHDIPEDIRSLAPADYVDLFTATVPETAAAASPEQWARAAMEGAPAAGRFLCWRALLGLRLAGGASPDHVAGWRIDGRGDDWIRVAARSWFLTAHIVFRADDGLVWFATFIRYDRRLGALVWPRAAVLHRAIAPDFLRAAVRRVERARR